jgi:hypothetical protein
LQVRGAASRQKNGVIDDGWLIFDGIADRYFKVVGLAGI